jgi:hypothetical protein
MALLFTGTRYLLLKIPIFNLYCTGPVPV